MAYAKFINSTHIKYPTADEFVGIIGWETHDTALRAKEYYPLINNPEQRVGATPTPCKFTFTQQTKTRIEPRPYEVEDYDPETGEKIGTHIEWRDTEITVDDSFITAIDWTWEPLPEPAKPTVQDYDDALEKHLYDERCERGYTTREPDYYVNSSVARWKQDAIDWIAHRDQVMLYGLEVENAYERGEEVPTLAQFKQLLPKIQWTIEFTPQ